ncbi:hypothetical protein [Bordetella sp. BOR01]|uniref:hypothetical protein n=1 Tax=Bordetella sp. BOR01 TaxID=2854779 RepID=UPI001C44A1C3|nr:hypothetical protein [Bordetella sp. BOR01]MBV7483509.1 hypothetical protein [Bordetella sp. BOR01]
MPAGPLRGGAGAWPRARGHAQCRACAVAGCLALQQAPVLQDQGYRWAEILVQGRGLDIDALAGVRAGPARPQH